MRLKGSDILRCCQVGPAQQYIRSVVVAQFLLSTTPRGQKEKKKRKTQVQSYEQRPKQFNEKKHEENFCMETCEQQPTGQPRDRHPRYTLPRLDMLRCDTTTCATFRARAYASCGLEVDQNTHGQRRPRRTAAAGMCQATNWSESPTWCVWSFHLLERFHAFRR